MNGDGQIKQDGETVVKKKWYQTSVAIALLLYFVWPVGLYLMWKHATWSDKVKKVLTVVVVGLFFMGIGTVLTTDPADVPSEDKTVNAKKELSSSDEKKYRKTIENYLEYGSDKDKMEKYSEKNPEGFAKVAKDCLNTHLLAMDESGFLAIPRLSYENAQANLDLLAEFSSMNDVFANDITIKEIEKGLQYQKMMYTALEEQKREYSDPDYIANHREANMLSGYIVKRLESAIYGYTDYYVMINNNRGEKECLVEFSEGTSVSQGKVSVRVLKDGTQTVQDAQGFEYDLNCYKQVDQEDIWYSEYKDYYDSQGAFYKTAITNVANGNYATLEEAYVEGWRNIMFGYVLEICPGTSRDDFVVYERNEELLYVFEVHWKDDAGEAAGLVGIYGVDKETGDMIDTETGDYLVV